VRPASYASRAESDVVVTGTWLALGRGTSDF